MANKHLNHLEAAMVEHAEDVTVALMQARAALRAVSARVNGAFDLPELVDFGPLTESATDDCRDIAQDALLVVEEVCAVIEAPVEISELA